jgi:pilus assembly protein CpaB
MSSGALRKFSIAMLMAAALLALVSFRMSREAEPTADAPVAAKVVRRVVVTERAVDAGATLTGDDVELGETDVLPAGGFEREEDVVGRRTVIALAAGERVLEIQLTRAGGLRGALRKGERAVAVKTDGVVGLGGFVEPGDRVDVLLYLQHDGREVETSQALVLLRDVRVIAYGARTLGTSPEHDPAEARTAVLAVRDDQAPVLMLGAHKGQLRLALRAQGSESDLEGDRHAATLGDVLDSAPTVQPFARPHVVIHRGTKRTEVAP